MNKSLIALLTVAAIIGTVVVVNQHMKIPKPAHIEQEVYDAFQDFKVKHQKNYNGLTETELYRLDVFASNFKIIKEHNESGDTFKMGVNQFADMTSAEFSSIMLSYRGDMLESSETKKNEVTLPLEFIKTSVDWRTQENIVTPVKNQKQCGSCWAFSTTGSLEGLAALNGHSYFSKDGFSEQQLVDCSKQNNGCNGGLMDYAFKYVETTGITSEENYAYTAKTGKKCISSEITNTFKNTGYNDVPAKSTSQLKAAVNLQPVSIAVDALKWQLYQSGVFSKCTGTPQLDHGVLLVGYQSSGEWIVKNSWGTSWGEEGYIRLKSDNQCGLANQASYPTL